MTRSDASDLARRLGRQAEGVCRHYLPNGRRDGQYWRVGNARGEAGRSMFVRLTDAPGGPAGKWADARNVPQIASKPDWARHGKSAPFKRNDAMLDALPIGALVFPGSGIQENFADKARQFGIPVYRFRGGSA